MAISVIKAVLVLGSPDPTADRWFSATFKVRAIQLGLMCHRLLPKAWRKAFSSDLRRAVHNAAADDAAAAGALDFAQDLRIRHRKDEQLWSKPTAMPMLAAVLAASSPVGSAHFEVFTGDVRCFVYSC